MTLVILSNDIAVNPRHVVDVVRDGDRNRIIITMVDGRTHSLPCEYGKSIFRTRDDLVKLINREAE